eukprot:gene6377-4602_t
MTRFIDHGEGVKLGFEALLPPEPVARKEKKMDICQDYQKGRCRFTDAECSHRHVISSFRHVQGRVCKHWLRGACINGDNCLYLHEYDDRFVPQCAFFERLGDCANPECPFLHARPEEKIPECGPYRRGFCPLGPQCPLRHVCRPHACPYYLAGFCPLGPQCPLGHPIQERFDWLSVTQRLQKRLRVEREGDPNFNPTAICHRQDCLDPGHTAPNCPGPQHSMVHKQLAHLREPGEKDLTTAGPAGGAKRCFTCHQEGHQARDCPHNPTAGTILSDVLTIETTDTQGGGELRWFESSAEENSTVVSINTPKAKGDNRGRYIFHSTLFPFDPYPVEPYFHTHSRSILLPTRIMVAKEDEDKKKKKKSSPRQIGLLHLRPIAILSQRNFSTQFPAPLVSSFSFSHFLPISLTGLILLSIPSILLHFVHGYIELFFLRFSPVLFTSPITTMDKYEVEKKLDEVDKVYLVRDRETDALYVRKKIYASGFQESEEMEILKELCSNPHVIQLIDDFPVPGCGSLHYVVMEYADGGDLGKAIEELKDRGLDSYSETDALFIVCSIALVLYDLYDCNVHHGDIKPTNVFLMSSGRVKVGDFGASKKLENASEERSAFRGTTSYCAPEIDGLGNGGTHKSDVFSLGIILYELLTLKYPFQVNGNIVEQKKRGYNGGYDVPPLPQSCSQTVKDLVQSMLENDPAKRIHIKDLMLLPFLQPYFRWIHAEAQKEDQQTELEELKKRFEATLEEENQKCKAALEERERCIAALEEKDQVIASKEEDLLAATVVISDLEHEVQQSNREKIRDMKCKIGAAEKNLKSQYNKPDRAIIEILDDDLQKPCNDAEEQAEAHLRATILSVKERLTPLLTPPLRGTIAADNVESVRRLVRMGADVMAIAENDTLPLLYFALLKTNMSVVVALLETPAPLDLTRSYPFSSREGAEKATFLDLVCKMPRSEVKPVVEAVITRLLRQKESGTPDTFTWAAPCKEIGGDDFISWLAKQGVLFDVWERLLESDISLVREGGYTISALNMCDADKKVWLWVELIITVDRGKARAQPLAVVYFQRVWMTLRLLNNRRIHRSRPLHSARVQGNTVHCVSPVPFRIAGPSFLQALRHEVVFLVSSELTVLLTFSLLHLGFFFFFSLLLFFGGYRPALLTFGSSRCTALLVENSTVFFRNAKGEVSLFKLSLAGTVVVEALDLYLLWRNYRKARATSEIPPDLKKEMSDKELDESKRYTVDSLRVSLFSSGVNMVSTIALKALKASPYIHGAIGRRLLGSCGSFRHAWILSIIEELLTTTISLPMSYYDTFVVEERHGFNKMTRRLFVLDCIKAFGLRVVLLRPLEIGLVQSIVTCFGPRFPVYLGGASLMVGVASMYILPSFIMPLFNTYSPLDSASNLYKKLEVLCEKTRFPLKQILTVDSSLRSGHSTAYVMGFMGIQQIVIYDTLISQASEDEMVAIISHELGHWSHMHVLQQLIVGTVEITLIAYGARAFIFNHKLVEDFGYASSDPFIGFSVFTDLLGAFSPLIQFLHVAMTRRCERQADCYAVRLGYGPPLRSGLVAVSKSNKGILESDWLFAAAKVSHPELPERLRRIAAEERILAAKGVTIDAWESSVVVMVKCWPLSQLVSAGPLYCLPADHHCLFDWWFRARCDWSLIASGAGQLSLHLLSCIYYSSYFFVVVAPFVSQPGNASMCQKSSRKTSRSGPEYQMNEAGERLLSLTRTLVPLSTLSLRQHPDTITQLVETSCQLLRDVASSKHLLAAFRRSSSTDNNIGKRTASLGRSVFHDVAAILQAAFAIKNKREDGEEEADVSLPAMIAAHGVETACGKNYGRLSIVARCYSCGLDQTCVMCFPCFMNSPCRYHRHVYHVASSGMCDCGDPDSWKEESFCSRHRHSAGADPLKPLAHLPEEDQRWMMAVVRGHIQYIVARLFDLLREAEPSTTTHALIQTPKFPPDLLPLVQNLYHLSLHGGSVGRSLLAAAWRDPLLLAAIAPSQPVTGCGEESDKEGEPVSYVNFPFTQFLPEWFRKKHKTLPQVLTCPLEGIFFIFFLMGKDFMTHSDNDVVEEEEEEELAEAALEEEMELEEEFEGLDDSVEELEIEGSDEGEEEWSDVSSHDARESPSPQSSDRHTSTAPESLSGEETKNGFDVLADSFTECMSDYSFRMTYGRVNMAYMHHAPNGVSFENIQVLANKAVIDDLMNPDHMPPLSHQGSLTSRNRSEVDTIPSVARDTIVHRFLSHLLYSLSYLTSVKGKAEMPKSAQRDGPQLLPEVSIDVGAFPQRRAAIHSFSLLISALSCSNLASSSVTTSLSALRALGALMSMISIGSAIAATLEESVNSLHMPNQMLVIVSSFRDALRHISAQTYAQYRLRACGYDSTPGEKSKQADNRWIRQIQNFYASAKAAALQEGEFSLVGFKRPRSGEDGANGEVGEGMPLEYSSKEEFLETVLRELWGWMAHVNALLLERRRRRAEKSTLGVFEPVLVPKVQNSMTSAPVFSYDITASSAHPFVPHSILECFFADTLMVAMTEAAVDEDENNNDDESINPFWRIGFHEWDDPVVATSLKTPRNPSIPFLSRCSRAELDGLLDTLVLKFVWVFLVDRGLFKPFSEARDVSAVFTQGDEYTFLLQLLAAVYGAEDFAIRILERYSNPSGAMKIEASGYDGFLWLIGCLVMAPFFKLNEDDETERCRLLVANYLYSSPKSRSAIHTYLEGYKDFFGHVTSEETFSDTRNAAINSVASSASNSKLWHLKNLESWDAVNPYHFTMHNMNLARAVETYEGLTNIANAAAEAAAAEAGVPPGPKLHPRLPPVDFPCDLQAAATPVWRTCSRDLLHTPAVLQICLFQVLRYSKPLAISSDHIQKEAVPSVVDSTVLLQAIRIMYLCARDAALISRTMVNRSQRRIGAALQSPEDDIAAHPINWDLVKEYLRAHVWGSCSYENAGSFLPLAFWLPGTEEGFSPGNACTDPCTLAEMLGMFVRTRTLHDVYSPPISSRPLAIALKDMYHYFRVNTKEDRFSYADMLQYILLATNHFKEALLSRANAAEDLVDTSVEEQSRVQKMKERSAMLLKKFRMKRGQREEPDQEPPSSLETDIAVSQSKNKDPDISFIDILVCKLQSKSCMICHLQKDQPLYYLATVNSASTVLPELGYKLGDNEYCRHPQVSVCGHVAHLACIKAFRTSIMQMGRPRINNFLDHQYCFLCRSSFHSVLQVAVSSEKKTPDIHRCTDPAELVSWRGAENENNNALAVLSRGRKSTEVSAEFKFAPDVQKLLADPEFQPKESSFRAQHPAAWGLVQALRVVQTTLLVEVESVKLGGGVKENSMMVLLSLLCSVDVAAIQRHEKTIRDHFMVQNDPFLELLLDIVLVGKRQSASSAHVGICTPGDLLTAYTEKMIVSSPNVIDVVEGCLAQLDQTSTPPVSGDPEATRLRVALWGSLGCLALLRLLVEVPAYPRWEVVHPQWPPVQISGNPMERAEAVTFNFVALESKALDLEGGSSHPHRLLSEAIVRLLHYLLVSPENPRSVERDTTGTSALGSDGRQSMFVGWVQNIRSHLRQCPVWAAALSEERKRDISDVGSIPSAQLVVPCLSWPGLSLGNSKEPASNGPGRELQMLWGSAEQPASSNLPPLIPVNSAPLTATEVRRREILHHVLHLPRDYIDLIIAFYRAYPTWDSGTTTFNVPVVCCSCLEWLDGMELKNSLEYRYPVLEEHLKRCPSGTGLFFQLHFNLFFQVNLASNKVLFVVSPYLSDCQESTTRAVEGVLTLDDKGGAKLVTKWLYSNFEM